MKVAIILPDLRKEAPTKIAIKIADEYHSHGYEVEVFVFRDLPEIIVNYKVNFLSFLKFHKVLNKFDLIHCHNLLPDLYVLFHKKKIKSKCISTLHNDIKEVYQYDGKFLHRMLVPFFWFKALKVFDTVVCLTNRAQLRLTSANIKSTVIINNGVSIDLTVPIDQSHINLINKIKGDSKLIGVVATLYHVKGLDQLLIALKNLEEYSLIIVGDGPASNHLKDLSVELGVDHRCYFLGRHLNGYSYFKFFDIYVMSSYSEGFPLTVLEAAASSVATVCSKIPVFEELFDWNEVCYFNLDDIQSLSDAINLCYSNREKLRKKFNASYELKYTEQKMLKKYVQLINDITNE